MNAHVLNLVTTARRSFYEHQRRSLRECGIGETTLSVPGVHRALDNSIRNRTILDYLRFWFRVHREVEGTYDLIHANYGLTAPFALAQRGVPTVLTLWGGEFIGNRYAGLIRRCTRRIDEVIVPSETMAGRLDRDCHIIPFPIDTEIFQPIDRERARDRIGWDRDEQIVLFPYARSRPEKNYALAERIVDELPIDASLQTIANKPYRDVPVYMNASDAVLVTSRWESGPMVVKEAMACNVPVISTDVGFAASVLDGVAQSGVASTKRGMREHLERSLRSGARSDGRKRIIGYTHEDMGVRLSAVYEACLTNG